MLWYLNAIQLTPELQDSLHNHQLFSVQSRQVLELRAASVVAGDELCRKLGTSAVALDYVLWDWSQKIKGMLNDKFPFHRTRSIYY
jgi:hypothetical protein